jgi:hydrogenase 3 maturation protease
MPDLRSRLEAWRGRRLWLLGVGNPERGDDGFGVRLVEALQQRLRTETERIRLIDVGTCPERYVGEAARAGSQDLVFADAVDFGGQPGALLLAGTEELLARPVSTATHRVPLAVLAQYAEGLGMRAWLLGVQPASLLHGNGLSPEVAGTLDALVALLGRALRARGDEGCGTVAEVGVEP